MKKNVSNLLCILTFIFCILLSGCYSVFSGGTGGLIVDAESTSTPKAGIANVDVYAYTNAGDRNSDFNRWKTGTVFMPHAEYYGHTTTGANGSFTINKLVWKSGRPDFGKDADYTEVYFLFYHENYGLTKGSTVIVSDSATDTVYAELTKVKKETVLSINMQDVATGSNTVETVYVEVSVPQTTEELTDVLPKVYKVNVTGSENLMISYPRWQSGADKTAGIETEPELTFTYYQNADEVTWKGCYNGDSNNGDYAFRDVDGKTVVSKTVRGSGYKVTLYGKATKFNVPVFSGNWGSKNGVTLTLWRSTDKGNTYTVNCGSVETAPRYVGADGTPVDGYFNSLGSGKYWFDDSYSTQTETGYYKITDGTVSQTYAFSTERTFVTVSK